MKKQRSQRERGDANACAAAVHAPSAALVNIPGCAECPASTVKRKIVRKHLLYVDVHEWECRSAVVSKIITNCGSCFVWKE